MRKNTRFGFDLAHLRGDLLGGITAGIVALPLALAFGLQSGMGAAAGLYGAICIGFVAALFGGTATQISGPTAPMTAVSMIVISGIIAANEGDVQRALPSILIVFLFAGLIQIALGFFRFGQYIRYMPYPVVSGFMTGIGVIIVATQTLPMLGYYPKEDAAFLEQFVPAAEEVILERILLEEVAGDVMALEDFEETIRRAETISREEIMLDASVLAANRSSGALGTIRLLGRAVQNVHFADLIMGVLTIAIIYGFKRITTVIPSTLVALLVVSIGAFLILPEYRTIGQIPSGFPVLHLEVISSFSFEQVRPYVFTAVSLAALGAIDSLLTSVVADNVTKTKHDPNQELIGQGIGNSVAAMFGGIPGAGATIRTIVNINAGGRTKASGMIAAISLLIVLLALGPLASKIPAAVLAGILVTVGIGVMDYKGLRHFRNLPIAEIVIMLSVLILTVFVGLIEAVLVGLILACILFMKHIADVVGHRTKTAPLRDFSREIAWMDEADIIEKIGDKVYIQHLDGPLFFGFALRLQEVIANLPKMEVVVIRMDRVPYVDQSGLYAMEDAVQDLQIRDVCVVFTDVHGQPLDMFERFNLIPGLVERKFCFDSFADCSKWLQERLG